MDLGWLFAAPIAHRGLHNAAGGLLENTPSAARAAADRGFGIECDVQLTADGEAVVFHDFALDRLTEGSGPVITRTAAQLRTIPIRGSGDRILPLSEFLDGIGGRVPVTIEIKSRFDGDMRLAERTAQIVTERPAGLALKSFDPEIVAYLRALPEIGGVPRGVVAQAAYDDGEWLNRSPALRRRLAEFLHFAESRPDFLSYRVHDLPHAVPYLLRTGLSLPVMTWTVRSPDEARHGRSWADQIVFEGFDPEGMA